MPRTLWRGTLSLGLVTIPVGLYTAVEDRSPSFNQLRASDHAPIGYKRVAKVDGQEVDYDDIVKGYEYERDRYVVFGPDELAALRPQSSRMIEIQQFVPLGQIDPIYFDRAYHVAPEPPGAKAYALLAEAMADRGTVAICTITLRDKEHLATLRLRDGIFVLSTMHWPDEVRAFSLSEVGIDEVPEPREQEVRMAHMLIESLTEDFDPDAFHDAYRERILEAVQAKVSGEEITVAEAAEPATVVDLMDALRRSVEESKKRKGGSAQAAS
ncbi:MAG: Ku protein [Solirubrobacterales bacterium]